MPFQAALTSDQLIKLRGDSSTSAQYSAGVYISLNSNAVVYSARINQVDFFFPSVDLTYDGGSGTLADVRVGMTVLISTSNDPAAAYFRGRIRLAPTADTIYINETGAPFADNDYVFILDDYDSHIKLPRWGGKILLDWENTYSGLPPLIYDLLPFYADMVDSVSGVYEISLAPTVVAAESGAAIDAYLWELPSGIVITAGADDEKDITIECDPGEYWIHFTVTDDAGNALTRHVKIFAHDDDNPPALLSFEDVSISCEIPIAVNEGASEGFSATITAFDQVAGVLDRTLVCIWTKETYNGEDGSLFNNVLMVGRLRNEANTSNYDDSNVDETVSLTIEGPLAILAATDAPSIEMVSGTADSDVVLTVADLTLWRNIWALLTLFSTFGEVYPVSFSSIDETFAYSDLVTQGSDLLSSIADLAQSICAVIQAAPDGRCEVVRRGVMLLPVDREDLAILANLDTRDYHNTLSYERDHRPSTSRVVADGGGYHPLTGTTSAYMATAPAGAPDDAPEESTLPRQILEAGQSITLEHNEIATRAGDALAASQPPRILSVTMLDVWRWLVPAVDQWFYWTLDGSETTRGLVVDNSTRWWLQAIEVGPDAQAGVMTVSATFIEETRGHAGQIIPFPVVDTGEFGFSIGDFGEVAELTPISGFTTDYDVSASQQGFIILFGSWSAGGFEPDCAASSQYLDIHKELDSVKTITEVTITYDATYAGGADNRNKLLLRVGEGAWQQVALWTTESGTDKVKVIPVPSIPADDIRIIMYADGAACTGDLLVKDISFDALGEADSWTHTWDFFDEDGDWEQADGYSTGWTVDVGWRGTDGSNLDRVFIKRLFASTYIRNISFTLSPTVLVGDNASAWLCPNDESVSCTPFASPIQGSTFNRDINDFLTSVSLGVERGGGDTSFLADIVAITITGSGTNPFA